MTSGTETILIVDDDDVIVELYSTILEAAGWADRLHCNDSREVMELIRQNAVSAILLDLSMPHISGQELLKHIAPEFPEIPVIILTVEDKIDVAVECMKIGAFDFMTKPISENRLVNSIAHAVRVHELQDEVHVLSRRHAMADLADPRVFERIITGSDVMFTVFAYIEAIARSPKALLITGESGTGKELVARAVHDASGRSGQFVAVSVSGLDDTVFSDTLFGHRRGAFTGADSVRKGLIEQAANGTLFLDEIGDLDNAAQVKLLRLLQEGEYYPLGSDSPGRSSARIIAATNADLQEKQGDGSFRRDLYYRLMAHHVRVPPLRERVEDIPLLLDHFITDSARLFNRPAPTAPARLGDVLASYSFPGNVRELQSLVYDVVSREPGSTLPVEYFIDYVESQRQDSGRSGAGTQRFSFTEPFPALSEVEQFLIEEALERSGGNQTVAARMLGISQS
ncbi:MAG: sigma-54 dependent transcriptional regulator, partial [Spirochaetia bacterium]